MSAHEPGDGSAQSSSSAGGTGALSHFGVCCFWTLGPVSHLSAALVHSAGPRPGHVTSPPALNLPWLSGPQTPSLPPEVWPEQLCWPLCARASGRLRLPLPRARLPASWSSVVSRASGPAWTVGRLSATPVGHRQVTLSLPGPGHRVVWGGRRPQGLMSLKILAGMDSAALKAGSKWPPPRPPRSDDGVSSGCCPGKGLLTLSRSCTFPTVVLVCIHGPLQPWVGLCPQCGLEEWVGLNGIRSINE